MTREMIGNLLKKLDATMQDKLRKQDRPDEMCMFVDTDEWKCSVYENRPLICRLFGFAENVPCPYDSSSANMAHSQFCILIESEYPTFNTLESVGETFTWRNVS